MKTAWDRYLEQQLADPVVLLAYEMEMKALGERSGKSKACPQRPQ